MTQEQLAALLGTAGLHNFDRVTVAKVEGQIRSVFDYELAIIARILKVDESRVEWPVLKIKMSREGRRPPRTQRAPVVVLSVNFVHPT